MPIFDRSFPYKLYEATNAASTGAVVFLGKSSKEDISNGILRPDLADKNCFTTFVFATIIAGKNVKISPATESDPYIFIDNKWFDFRPCGGIQVPSQWPKNSLLSKVNYDTDNDNIEVTFKSIVSDGTVEINTSECEIEVECLKYYCGTLGSGLPFYSETVGVNGTENTIFAFKSLLAGDGISLCDDGKSITISFDAENYRLISPPDCMEFKYEMTDAEFDPECSDLTRRAEILIDEVPFPGRLY